jgi:D-glycero-beta-D-manno-heptose 1-phosphate adenylyltransferase
MSEKNISVNELGKLRKRWRAQKKKVVFTNGCFDLLHPGHTRYLADARSQGDLLVVGLNTDASVRKIKGALRPIMAQKDRAEVLAALRSVDYIILFNEDTPEKLIAAVEPDVLVKGADWAIDKIVGADRVLKKGGAVRRISFAKGYSTSAIIEKVVRNYCPARSKKS